MVINHEAGISDRNFIRGNGIITMEIEKVSCVIYRRNSHAIPVKVGYYYKDENMSKDYHNMSECKRKIREDGEKFYLEHSGGCKI